MSLPAAAKAAAKHLAKDVVTENPTARSAAPNFLSFRFEPHPRPINCTTYAATKEFASDPSHPLHIKMKRRLAVFDPSILHWNVRAPLELSKKAVVRSWAIRRVRVAFQEALKEGGWNKDGSRIVAGENGKLSGALCIHVNKNKMVLEASGAEVKQQCIGLLRRVVGMHASLKGSVDRRKDARRVYVRQEGKKR